MNELLRVRPAHGAMTQASSRKARRTCKSDVALPEAISLGAADDEAQICTVIPEFLMLKNA